MIDYLQIKPIIVALNRKNVKNNVIIFKIIKQKIRIDFYINIIERKNHEKP